MTTFEKINVWPIITDHIGTLYDYRTNERSYPDLLLFFILPLVPAGFVLWKGLELPAIAVAGLLTASSIFVTLLMNLLVMVLGFLRATRGNPADKLLQLRKRYLREVVANLSFSILVALAMVGTSIIALFTLRTANSLVAPVFTSLLTAGGVLLVLSLLMVLRRMYTLIQHEFDRHKLKQGLES